VLAIRRWERSQFKRHQKERGLPHLVLFYEADSVSLLSCHAGEYITVTELHVKYSEVTIHLAYTMQLISRRKGDEMMAPVPLKKERKLEREGEKGSGEKKKGKMCEEAR